MRPLLVEWLARHGLPSWLAPDYMVLVGIASLACAVMVLRFARREGAPVHVEARALVFAYLVAIPGGYVFEAIRAIPTALAQGSLVPIATAGRAAYGGLIASVAVSIFYLRRHRQPIGPHLDRIAPAAGIIFAFVRTGCFLAGCDYGRPTASAFGVRFPAGSLAAIDHAERGFVPLGAASLPVHPTELYEVAVALVATLVALRVRARRLRGEASRAGDAFLAWLGVYALGRFLVETLRGDAERGLYLSLSTGQWVSIVMLAGIMLVVVARTRRARLLAASTAAIVAMLSAPRVAHAQQNPDRPPTPTPPSPYYNPPPPPPPTPPPSTQPPPSHPPPNYTPGAYTQPGYVVPPYKPPPQEEIPVRRFGVRASITSSLTLGRKDVPSGTAGEIAALYRAQLGSSTRIDFGLEYRHYVNITATHRAVGVPVFLVLEASRRVEFTLGIAFDHNWIAFKSPFFEGTNAWSTRYEFGFQGYPGNHFFLGGTLLAFNVLSSEATGVITSWEPRLWVGIAL